MADRPYLSLAEMAERLDFKERRVRALVKQHGIPVLQAGRDIRFDDQAIRAFEDALRCPSASHAAKAPAPSRSLGLSPDRAYAAALKATTCDSPAKKRPTSKP